jgi:hypothetical protein
MIKRNPENYTIQQACKRIVFKQAIQTKDGEGGFVTTWVNFLPRWAAILPIKAQQVFNFKSVNVEATHYIKTRGYLTLPTGTKWAGSSWVIEWSGLEGETVKIEYKIGSGSFSSIISSTANDGSYAWTVQTNAIGENVVIRVTDITAPAEYFELAPALVVASTVINREANEKDRIFYGSREFEILTIEDIQEKNFSKFITCKELR